MYLLARLASGLGCGREGALLTAAIDLRRLSRVYFRLQTPEAGY